jgi:propionaldehyde dehydrogenase
MTEQLMPVLPVVRVKDFEEALECAVKAECGYRHTAMIHSRNLERISRFSQALGATITVVNAPSGAGLGINSEGTFTHTLAEPTGEGVVTPRKLVRERRIIGVSSFQLI